MACGPKKKVLHKFVMKELSPVTKPAMEGALSLIVKSEDGMDKQLFDQCLQELEIAEAVREATDDMWELNDALRTSIRAIIANKEQYPDTIAAIKLSLSQFCEAVTEMVSEAVGEVEDELSGEVEDDTETEDEAMAKGKKEGGKVFPASDYAYVPDPEKPSTWKLRLTSTPGGGPDPRIVGAAVAALGPGFRGNKVQLPSNNLAAVKKKVKSAWLKANPDKSSEDLPEILKLQEETMSKERTVEVIEAELAISKAYGELNDAEKAHYNRLDESGKAAFLKMAKDARANELNKAAESDPVVYTAEDGSVFRKSDDPRLVKMAKDNDQTNRELKKERDERETLEFTKRATEELGNLPGEMPSKIALLKAVEKIEDKEVRTSVLGILKSHCESFKPAFETRGSSSLTGPTASLDAMAKKYAEDHKLSYEKAYSEVISTPEGKRLYEQTLS